MADNQKIGIVTVLYNSETVLEDFFRTLGEQTYKHFVLYLVDNASKDASVSKGQEYAQQVSFECRWLLQQENLGVAEGNNIGIKAALADGCEYVLLANNDIVLQSDTIEKLLEGMLDMQATMAVPKIYYWDDPKRIWMAGGDYYYIQCTSRQRGFGELDEGQYDTNTDILYAPTCFMLLKASVFDAVGYMDKRYFVYYDDTDFVWRALKRHHQRLVYIHDARLWHKVSSCTGGSLSNFSIYYLHRNQVLFILKNMSFFRKMVLFAYIVTHYFFKDIFRYTKEQRKILLKAYLDGVKLLSQPV